MPLTPDLWFSRLREHGKRLLATQGQDFVLAPLGSENGAEIENRSVIKDKDYVRIRISSSRIRDVRRWTTTYYGSIHSAVSYLHEDHGLIEFSKVITPEKMRELDPSHADRLIQVDKLIFGPAPYRGGLSLKIGLFSVKSSDLTAPYLDLLSMLAETAGVSALNSALRYADPLRKGAELLFGNQDQSHLEIGVDVDWAELETGTWLAMRAPKDLLDLNDLRMDRRDAGLITKDGAPFRRYPYMIFTIEASDRRDDWMLLPEIKLAWDAIGKAVRLGEVNRAEHLMRQFVLVVRTSADLVTSDVNRLTRKAQDRLHLIQSETAMAYQNLGQSFPELVDLDLYDDHDSPHR